MRARLHRHRSQRPLQTYRYYTCWYGNKAGCDIHRFNADELEAAIGDALLDFFTTGHQLITDAITRFQQTHAASTGTKHERLASVKNELRDNTTAVDRYLTAFERGTLNDDAPEIRARLNTLESRAKALRARKAELELSPAPRPLGPADLAEIQQTLTSDNHMLRKSLFEALIQEVTIIADDAVFKLPLAGNDEGPAPEGLTLTDRDPNQMVRALPSVVGDTGIEPVTSPV
ncbi:hypothetical protein Aab01nite_31660 [Paractinoplanes abujensis]|nr:hypothetical protein Aab01nite_31660 [Actinoplanes abujensis]